MDSAQQSEQDVVVLGGALAGAATALLLRRRNPQLRVLILEGSERFKRRVGESTVEVSALFLGRVLGLTDHLLEHHLPKQGMRFWFANDRTRALDQCSETGPRYNVRLPGYQVDRAVLDEHVLAVATSEGAQVERGVRIRQVRLAEGAAQTVSWQDRAGQARETAARWVVDASGVAAILARQEGWLVANREHPTATCWSRWRGVRSLDGRELAARYPAWANRVPGLRSTATNHLTGRGWWAWIIPLKGGDVSIGVVYDERLVELPAGPNLGERLRAMLCTHPVGRELLEGAEWTGGDVHFRRHLAYSSTKYATDGAVTVGDAAAFIDPLYSPGMDWIAFTTSAAARLIHDSFRGRPVAPRVAQHNANFTRAYARWFRALYLDKYHYLGDYDLMTLAFRLDLGLYYAGVVALPFRHGHHLLETPPFAHPRTEWAYRVMAFYNRRFVAIAQSRHRRGVYGRNNDRRHFGFISYEFNRRLPVRLAGLFCLWLGLELREGWRTWWARSRAVGRRAEPLAAPPLPSQP